MRKITLGLLCVPADAAQRVADQMIASGITGILNFAPVPLTVPPASTSCRSTLSIQLENLAYKAQSSQNEEPERRFLRRLGFAARPAGR